MTWVYVEAFGSPTLCVAGYLIQNERLPWFFDTFEMYGGARTEASSRHSAFPWCCSGISPTTAVAAFAAGRIWDGSRPWAVFALVLLPVEAAFWFLFYQPLPWTLGVVRVGLLVTAWPTLWGRREDQTRDGGPAVLAISQSRGLTWAEGNQTGCSLRQ